MSGATIEPMKPKGYAEMLAEQIIILTERRMEAIGSYRAEGRTREADLERWIWRKDVLECCANALQVMQQEADKLSELLLREERCKIYPMLLVQEKPTNATGGEHEGSD